MPDPRLSHVQATPVEAMVPPVEPDDDALAGAIDAILDQAEIVTERRQLIHEMVATSLRLGTDDNDRLDLKIAGSALMEMRAAFALFAPLHDVPKVTIFGSARTEAGEPGYVHAHDVARDLAAEGWMVVTGAGPGIMQAAMEGAGVDQSIGVSIRLPFETSANAVIAGDDKLVSMKYFFTRKLMLVKESKAFVSVPGGFGTMDETFELLTLQQTGKAEPTPIVLLDQPGGTYWHGFSRFVTDELVPAGLVAGDDLERVLITESVDDAVTEICDFWRNYDSLRWVGTRLVLRLRAEPTDAEVDDLNVRFGRYLAEGTIAKTGPYGPERANDDKVDLPRLVMTWDQFQIGELHRLIRALNSLDTAPSEKAVVRGR